MPGRCRQYDIHLRTTSVDAGANSAYRLRNMDDHSLAIILNAAGCVEASPGQSNYQNTFQETNHRKRKMRMRSDGAANIYYPKLCAMVGQVTEAELQGV